MIVIPEYGQRSFIKESLERFEAIDQIVCPKTRNHLEGAVTRLSASIAHVIMTLSELAKMP